MTTAALKLLVLCITALTGIAFFGTILQLNKRYKADTFTGGMSFIQASKPTVLLRKRWLPFSQAMGAIIWNGSVEHDENRLE